MIVRAGTGSRRAGGRVRLPAPATLVALGALVVAVGACQGSAESRTHVVEMRAFVFQPDTVRAAVGDTVVWINRDLVPHTATSSEWDSGEMKQSAEWRLVVESEGEVSYLCTLHPSMTGVVTGR